MYAIYLILLCNLLTACSYLDTNIIKVPQARLHQEYSNPKQHSPTHNTYQIPEKDFPLVKQVDITPPELSR